MDTAMTQLPSMPLEKMIAIVRVAMYVLLLGVCGCHSRTHNFLMRGAMNMTGQMHMAGQMNTSLKTDNTASRLACISVQCGDADCGKVAIVDVDGLLVNKSISGVGSMGENPVALFREKLDFLRTDPTIRAVVLRINSPGGGVTASDIMARDLQEFKAQTQIPVIACLMDVGTGGAYLIAIQADQIVAHPTSIVGGIGVIFNVYNLEDALGQFNIASIPIKSGEHIDIASPERTMGADERKSLQKIADSFHQRFMDQVKVSRKLSGERLELFDGQIFTGTESTESGLVDKIGYLDDAISMARERALLTPNSAIVMLRRDNDRAHSQFDVTPNTPYSLLPFKMPGLERSSLPTFLYMWQPDSAFLTASDR
jgi:protease IV